MKRRFVSDRRSRRASSRLQRRMGPEWWRSVRPGCSAPAVCRSARFGTASRPRALPRQRRCEVDQIVRRHALAIERRGLRRERLRRARPLLRHGRLGGPASLNRPDGFGRSRRSARTGTPLGRLRQRLDRGHHVEQHRRARRLGLRPAVRRAGAVRRGGRTAAGSRPWRSRPSRRSCSSSTARPAANLADRGAPGSPIDGAEGTDQPDATVSDQPAPFDRRAGRLNDLIDFTPALRAEALESSSDTGSARSTRRQC